MSDAGTGRCTECGAPVDECACCEEPDCGAPICLRCLGLATGQRTRQPVDHSG